MNDQRQPGNGWTVVLRRRPVRMVGAARKAATPRTMRSSAATAVMILT